MATKSIRPRSPVLVAEIDWAPGAKFTDKFLMRALSAFLDGAHAHIERLVFRLTGALHADKDSTDCIVWFPALLPYINWAPNKLTKPLVDKQSAANLLALYEAEHGGRLPTGGINGGTVSAMVHGYKFSALTATDKNFVLNVPLDYKRPRVERADDELLAVRLVQDSQIALHTGTLANATIDDGGSHCAFSILGGKIQLLAYLRPLPYVNGEVYTAFTSDELPPGGTSPSLSAAPAAAVTAIIMRPGEDGDPVTTDANTVGLKQGSFQAIATTTEQAHLVESFNEQADVEVTSPAVGGVAGTVRGRFTPVEFPGRHPQRFTQEAIDLRLGIRLDFDALSVKHELVQRLRVFGSQAIAEMDAKMKTTGVRRDRALSTKPHTGDVAQKTLSVVPAKIWAPVE